jgi:hypothetical protein
MVNINFTTLPSYLYALILGVAGGLIFRAIRYTNRPGWALGNKRSWPYVLGGGVFGPLLLLLLRNSGWSPPDIEWILVAAIGAAVGVGELASRYRDAPIKAILSVPATVYVLLNAGAAVFALALGRYMHLWTTSDAIGRTAVPVNWAQVLTAGFGAMVILRGSIFNVRVGDKNVEVGPSTFLQSVIEAADRAVDRLRAQERAWTVAAIMEGVASDKAIDALPSYITALMQNMSQEDQTKFAESVSTISGGKASGQLKAWIVGLSAMNYTGEGVLRAAVTSLDAQIRLTVDQGAAPPVVSPGANSAASTAQNAAWMQRLVSWSRFGGRSPQSKGASPRSVIEIASKPRMPASAAHDRGTTTTEIEAAAAGRSEQRSIRRRCVTPRFASK